MTNEQKYDMVETAEAAQDEFIMKPKVDYCFKELMKKEGIRKAFVAALLHKRIDEVQAVMLLPTELSGDYPDEKLGILDVRVVLHCNGVRYQRRVRDEAEEDGGITKTSPIIDKTAGHVGIQ